MKNQLPTFEEFRSETKKKLKLSLSHLNDKELEKFVLECEKCEKTITVWPQNRYKIHKHIKNCKGKKYQGLRQHQGLRQQDLLIMVRM